MKHPMEKLADPVEQELERREMMQRVYGRSPTGHTLRSKLRWVLLLALCYVAYRFFT